MAGVDPLFFKVIVTERFDGRAGSIMFALTNAVLVYIGVPLVVVVEFVATKVWMYWRVVYWI